MSDCDIYNEYANIYKYSSPPIMPGIRNLSEAPREHHKVYIPPMRRNFETEKYLHPPYCFKRRIPTMNPDVYYYNKIEGFGGNCNNNINIFIMILIIVAIIGVLYYMYVNKNHELPF